ncbi:MAG: molybdenum cofactor guanylyltransferase, partial [Deinococcus sp.]|nr:molybdenum cofactor guanylyltransferase [Deinococcus sp.]
VLAGGASRRFGRNKALVDFRGQPLIQRVADALLALCPTVVITNTPEVYAFLELPMYPDVYPRQGPAAGIHAALYHSGAQRVLAVACDMPFLSLPLLKHLVAQQGYYVVVPCGPEDLEPLCAVYRRECLPFLEAQLQLGGERTIAFYTQVPVLQVPWEEVRRLGGERCFWNLNTYEEYQVALGEKG